MRTTYSRGNSRGIRTHSHLFVSCKLCVKTPNKAKNDRRITGRTTVKKPVRRRRRKKNRSLSALARSRKRHARFLENNLAGKPDLAWPEEDQQDSDNSVNRNLVSPENSTPSPASDPDLLNEQAILCEFLDTIDIGNDVVVSSASVS